MLNTTPNPVLDVTILAAARYGRQKSMVVNLVNGETNYDEGAIRARMEFLIEGGYIAVDDWRGLVETPKGLTQFGSLQQRILQLVTALP